MLGAISLLPLALSIFVGGGKRGEKHANIACVVLNYRIKIGFILVVCCGTIYDDCVQIRVQWILGFLIRKQQLLFARRIWLFDLHFVIS